MPRAKAVVTGRVLQRTDAGYHGHGMPGIPQKDWHRATAHANYEERARSSAQSRRRFDRHTGYQALGFGAGMTLPYAALVPVARRNQAKTARENRAKAAKLSKADVFRVAEPGMRQASRRKTKLLRRTVHSVTGADVRQTRARRTAEWVGRHPAAATAAATSGLLVGPAVLVGGTRDSTRDLRRSQLELNRARRAARIQAQGNAVGKSLYYRDERVSPLHAAGTAAAGVLALYGLGHSKLVGRQIVRGIKIAEHDGNQRAAEALRRAQAARGSIRAGMAPGEAALRRIRAVNEAIEAVPKPIRGDVALAAGVLLGSRSQPVRHRSYERAW